MPLLTDPLPSYISHSRFLKRSNCGRRLAGTAIQVVALFEREDRVTAVVVASQVAVPGVAGLGDSAGLMRQFWCWPGRWVVSGRVYTATWQRPV
jgi:hypothetical protein